MQEAGQLSRDVAVLKAGLGEMPQPVACPCLVVVSGLPGTGKSYFCRRLAERAEVVVLESDRLRKTLFSSPTYGQDEHLRLFPACHALVRELLAGGVSVAFDATNLEERHREPLYHIADQVGAELVIVQVSAPEEVVHKRLENRERGLDSDGVSDASRRVYQAMQSRADRIRRSHYVVDTSKDISPALDKVVHRISRPVSR